MKPLGCLLPLTIPYGAVISLRNRFYDHKVLPIKSVGVPVISIGNISVGGTGKSPTVMYLANLWAEKYKKFGKIAVVSRGYKGSNEGTLVVSDGKNVKATVEVAGDEPFMIASKCKHTIVIVDKNRFKGAQYAVEEHKAHAIILDDGFQHRKLGRDLDIVLLDGKNPLGNNRLMPAGFLREPTKSLKRADIIVLSKAEGSDDDLRLRGEKLTQLLNKPIVVTRMKPTYLRKLSGGELLSPEEINGKKVFAFAGIAKPEYFFEELSNLGANLVKQLALADHIKYDQNLIDVVSRQYVASGADCLVTTEKDAVKLPKLMSLLPIYQLETKLEVVYGADYLEETFRRVILSSKDV